MPASAAATAEAIPAVATAWPIEAARAMTEATDSVVTGSVGSDRLREAAAAGDPAAAFEVATRYAEGRGVAANLATAAEWYARAAEGGIAVAQYRLGSLYERGQGVKKDLVAAVKWYQRAADQGNVGAMHNLAVLMSEGVDEDPDPAKALQWFLAAANYGVKDSEYNLGVIYARGIGTQRDMSESYKWFAIAAAQGDKDAAGRRDEVAGTLTPDQLAKARAAVSAWKAKPPLAEANVVSAPAGGWDGDDESVTAADQQALVKKIQALLTEQGYDVGTPDGVAGPRTRDAVKAYQRSIGAAETGQIDQKLVASLSDR
jgi:localization factor PodJL